jgi:hypothetical protein
VEEREKGAGLLAAANARSALRAGARNVAQARAALEILGDNCSAGYREVAEARIADPEARRPVKEHLIAYRPCRRGNNTATFVSVALSIQPWLIQACCAACVVTARFALPLCMGCASLTAF